MPNAIYLRDSYFLLPDGFPTFEAFLNDVQRRSLPAAYDLVPLMENNRIRCGALLRGQCMAPVFLSDVPDTAVPVTIHAAEEICPATVERIPMEEYDARLREVGIPLPELYEVDEAGERLLKEYIDGETVYETVKRGPLAQTYWDQIKAMCARLYPAGLNIDYFPTNFVLQNGVLYYIDYECNGYMEQWDFEHWGWKYWQQTPEFLEHWHRNG